MFSSPSFQLFDYPNNPGSEWAVFLHERTHSLRCRQWQNQSSSRVFWINTGNYFFANSRLVLMAEVDPEALADVAYGIFEHLLNRRLREQGRYLYMYVEEGIDFKAELSAIFDAFREEYPQLA